MQLEMSLHVTLGCEYFSTLHTSVLRLDFGMSLHVFLVKVSILEFPATNITFENGHLRWSGQLCLLAGGQMILLLTLYHRLGQDIQFGLGSRSLLLLNVLDVALDVPVIGQKLKRHLRVNDGLCVDAR